MAYKLIVVEWSPSVQKIIRMAFPESEFEIYPFRDGDEVEQALSRINPDAVLLNLSLSNKDGYDVGSYLKSQKRFAQTPLFLLKGAFDSLDEERLANLAYEGIVSIPFDSEKLFHTVRDVIERNRNPQTFPEEPMAIERTTEELEKGLEEEITDLQERDNLDLDKILSDLRKEMQEEIQQWIKQERLEKEKDLERRIGDRVVSEIKEWLQNRDSKK